MTLRLQKTTFCASVQLLSEYLGFCSPPFHSVAVKPFVVVGVAVVEHSLADSDLN